LLDQGAERSDKTFLACPHQQPQRPDDRPPGLRRDSSRATIVKEQCRLPFDRERN
jgi:hypothetical protein